MTTAIDLFAGCGGFSTGGAQAGVNVKWAANHWPLAVRCHAQNHPTTEHACQDLHQADWTKVPKTDLVLASPCCQGHTKARGKDGPHHDASRSTAWAVVSCCEYHRPKAFIVENVPEFLKWSLYPAWHDAMRRLGYLITANVLDAADAGVPQNRVRLFLVGARRKITTETPQVRHRNNTAHATARSFIDFDAGRWSKIEKPGRAAATLRKVAAGRQEFGRRFLVSYYGTTKGGRSLDRPVGTITTKDRWAVIDGDRMRMLTTDECRAAMGFPDSYKLSGKHKDDVHLLGNAVPPPLARHVIEQVCLAL